MICENVQELKKNYNFRHTLLKVHTQNQGEKEAMFTNLPHRQSASITHYTCTVQRPDFSTVRLSGETRRPYNTSSVIVSVTQLHKFT